MKGAIRRSFRDRFDIGIFPFASRITHLFPISRVFISPHNIFRDVALSVLVGKLANASNRILVSPIKIIISGTCDTSGFLATVINMKIAVVSELTA